MRLITHFLLGETIICCVRTSLCKLNSSFYQNPFVEKLAVNSVCSLLMKTENRTFPKYGNTSESNNTIPQKMDSTIHHHKNKTSSNEFQISQLKNYFVRMQSLDNDPSLERIPGPIKSFFLLYIKHIQSIDSAVYCLNNLFKMNESVKANWPQFYRFNDMMQTFQSDLKEITHDLINHLIICDSSGPTRVPSENILKDETLVQNSSNATCEFSDNIGEWQLNEVIDSISNSKKSCQKRKLQNDDSSKKKNRVASNSESTNFLPDHLQGLKFNEKGTLLVYVDGACSSNGKSSAQAGYGVWFNHNHPLNSAAPVKGTPTNNNAEIQAATQAIRQASSIGIKKIKLYTDSQFLINCMTQWIHKWKRNNWMTSTKMPVKNKESLLDLDSVMPLMEKVEWEYVEGHKGIVGNEQADLLAKKGAALYRNRTNKT